MPLTQRPDLQPLPVNVARHIRIGTVLWAFGFVLLLPFVDELEAAGHLWWLGTAGTGIALGLIGLVYLHLRERH